MAAATDHSFRAPRLLPWLVSLLLLLHPAAVSVAAAQGRGEDPPPLLLDDAPLVYLDCQRCWETHIRSEIDFVNHVREAAGANVHVLITSQPTGGGGR
jgi:hypothetical protein